MNSIIKKRNKKPYIIVAASLIILLGGYVAFALISHKAPFANNTPQFASPGEQKIDLARSDAEKKASQALQDDPSLKTKNDQTDTPDSPTQTSSGKTVVNVLLTNAGITNGTVSASAFVTNLVEEGGDCTYTFTNGSVTIKKSTKTLTNPTSTTCETVRFSSDELNASGSWKVIANYNSEAASGTSNTQEFTK